MRIGEACEGWGLLAGAELAVTEEHVPRGVVQRFSNESDEDVVFLVMLAPSTTGDRTERP